MGKAVQFLKATVFPYQGDTCLIWPYSRDRHGYGKIKIDGRIKGVHRVACETIHGPAPSELHEVAHSCGRGHEGCVNPHHLRWATPKENQSERNIHGTHSRGERHGASKLTEADVREIREAQGSQRNLAAKFGVSQSTISLIKLGKKWRHL